MKEYFLPIGQRQEAVLLPEEHVIYDIHGNAATVCADVVAAAREAIRNPIGTKPLREIVRAKIKGEYLKKILSFTILFQKLQITSVYCYANTHCAVTPRP